MEMNCAENSFSRLSSLMESESVLVASESLDLEVSKLALRASGRDAACLAGPNAFRLKQRITQYWDVATVKCAEPLYYRKATSAQEDST